MIRNNIRAFLRQIELELKSTFRYRFSLLSDILIFSLLMAFFISANIGMSFADKYNYQDHKTLMLSGYLAWTIAIAALSGSVQTVSSELTRGIFYRKINSKCSLTVLMFGNLLATMMIEILVVTVLLLIAYLVWNIAIPFTFLGLIAIFVNTIGMYGIGLIVGGLCVRYKRVGSITLIIQLALLVLTDTIPTGNIMLYVTKVIPLTSCNEILRIAISGGNVTKPLIILILSSIIWVFIGEIIFRFSIKSAKKRGNLLFY